MAMKDIRRNVMIQSMMNALEIQTATGNPVAFNAQIVKPLKSIIIPLTYIQEGTGDPSPTNIRTISGANGLFCVHAKKNIGYLRGYSATNKSYSDEGALSNNYGTTISTTSPESSVTITQSDASTDYAKSNYRNGYFSIRTDNMVDGQYYDISFKVTNITSNPLDASLSDWMIMPGQGSGSVPSEVKDDVVIVKNQLYREAVLYRQGWEVRNCGMSCTISEFMVTPANTNDGVYEAYDGGKLDVVLPALGKNLFDKSTGIELTEANILVARHDGYGVPFHMTAGTTYIIYANSSTKPNEITLRVPLSTTTIAIAYTQNTGYITYTPEEDVDVAFNVYWTNGRPEDATDLMIETESKTSYEPYNNTVYGGSLDTVSGVLNVTYGCHIFNGGETFMHLDTRTSIGIERHIFNTTFLDNYAARNYSSLFKASTAVRTADGSSSNPLCFYNGTPPWQFGFYIDSSLCEATEDSFKAWLAEHPCQVVFPLKEPFDVQLTPASASAFIGDNTVWTNTSENLTVTYKNKKSQGT